MVALIAQTGQAPATRQPGTKTVLLCLGGGNVKDRQVHTQSGQRIARLYLHKADARVQMTRQFCRQQSAAQRYQNGQCFVMTPDGQFAVIFSLVDRLRHKADHPHHTQQMVGVCMRDKQVVQMAGRQTGILQLAQNTVAAAGIDQQKVLLFLQGKAGIVAAGHHGVACAQHD